MKNLFTAIILGIALAGFSFAQTSPVKKSGAQQSEKIKMAVVEFSPAKNVTGMTDTAKRQFQASMAYEISFTKKFRVIDVGWTRDASKANLTAINSATSTAAAVKLGKTLDVDYVLTGIVTEYTPKAADGYGRVVFTTRLIEVATGKVVQTVETNQRSNSPMSTTNESQIQTKAIKPAVKGLAAKIAGLNLK